jgi:hypothetical protein
MLARDKHSILLQKSVNHGQKSFITVAPRSNLSSPTVNLDFDDERLVAGVHREVLGVPVGGATLAVNRRTWIQMIIFYVTSIPGNGNAR